MPSASFAEPHTYRVDGHVVPSVTQVLTLAGMSYVSDIPPRILERAAAIGTAVHQAAELLDEDDLDLDSLDPSVTGYVLAYQKFREAAGFQPELVEHRRIATVLGLRYGRESALQLAYWRLSHGAKVNQR